MAERLGPYELCELLGRGGAASVHSAVDTRNGSVVALKVLQSTDEAGAQARFEREATVLARLAHPNIVRFYEYGHEGRTSYFALQYIDGPSLETTLREARRTGKPLPAGRLVAIAMSLLSALHYIEELSLYHRDVKPANVLLDREGHVFLSDFGLARFSSLTRLTRDGHAVGTVKYMSPEQLLAEDVDHRSDLYQVGLLIYEMAYGPLPQLDPNAYESARRRILDGLPIPNEPVAGLAPGLSSFLTKACALNPDERFQHARDMALALVDLATASSVDVLPPEFRSPSAELKACTDVLRGPDGATTGYSTVSVTATTRSVPARRRWRTVRAFALGALIGAVIGLVGSFALFAPPLRDPFAATTTACAEGRVADAGALFDDAVSTALLAGPLDETTRRRANSALACLAPRLLAAPTNLAACRLLLDRLDGNVALHEPAASSLGDAVAAAAAGLPDAEAVGLLERAHHAGARSPSSLRLAARLALAAGRYGTARTCAALALRRDGDDAAARLILGQAARADDLFRWAEVCRHGSAAAPPATTAVADDLATQVERYFSARFRGDDRVHEHARHLTDLGTDMADYLQSVDSLESRAPHLGPSALRDACLRHIERYPCDPVVRSMLATLSFHTQSPAETRRLADEALLCYPDNPSLVDLVRRLPE